MSIILAGFALGISLIVAIGPQNVLLIKQGVKREFIGAVVAVCALSDIALIFGGTAGVGVLVERFPTALIVLKYAGAAYLAYFTYLCFRDAIKPGGEGLNAEDPTPHHPHHVDSFDGNPGRFDEAGDDGVGYDDYDGAGFNSAGSGGGVGGGVATMATVAIKAKRMTKRITRRTVTHQSWLKPVLAALAICWLNPAAYVDVLVMLGGMANQYGNEGRWLFALGAVTASMVWFPTLGYGAARFSKVLARPRVWRIINFAVGFIMIGLTIKLLLH